jgi:hypothetical protein
MRVVADTDGWELVETAGEPVASTPPVSATVSTTAPGSGVFRKVADERAEPSCDGAHEALDAKATMATDPAPASGDADETVRLPAPARLPPDLTGDKTRVSVRPKADVA